MSFSTQLKEITLKADKAVDKTIRGTTLALFRGIMLSTPVDKGRLLGNWQTTTGNPASGTVDRIDKTAALVFAEALAQIGGTGSVNYLTNNLPYAHRIEYDGWSKVKAPAGMVRVNFARIDAIVAKQVRDNKV